MKKKITPKTILVNLDSIITGVTLALCVILVNLNVLMRYFLNNPLIWCEELVTSLFVWTVFIGSAYAHRTHSHIGVDIVVNLFPPKSKAVVREVVRIVELCILIMLTVISAQYVYNLIFSRGVLKIAYTDLLRVPKWWTGIAVPIGFGLSAIYSAYFIYKDLQKLFKGKKNAGEEGGVEA